MAPGIRPCDHSEARAPRAAASTLGASGSPVPESSCLGSPSRVPLLARSYGPARSSREPPPRGQVPYWVRSGLAERGLPELFSREFRERLPAAGCGIAATGARAGRRSASACRAASACAPSSGSGCRRTAAGAASSCAAGSGTLLRLVGAAAADRGDGSQPPHLRGRGVRSAAGGRAGAEESVRLQAGAPARPPPRPAAAAGRCRRRGPRSTGRS